MDPFSQISYHFLCLSILYVCTYAFISWHSIMQKDIIIFLIFVVKLRGKKSLQMSNANLALKKT